MDFYYLVKARGRAHWCFLLDHLGGDQLDIAGLSRQTFRDAGLIFVDATTCKNILALDYGHARAAEMKARVKNGGSKKRFANSFALDQFLMSSPLYGPIYIPNEPGQPGQLTMDLLRRLANGEL